MRFSAAALRGLVPVLLAACATAQPLLDRADEALVRVVVATAAGRSYGSGFFVEERYVVTNHHVVQEALSPLSSARLFVIPHGAETEAPVDIVLHDARSDLAVLHYTGRASHAPLPLAATTPNPLARVFAMGYPVAVSDVAIGPTPSSTGLGFLSNDPYDGQLGAGSVRVLQHSADINPGNSGGPLIDDCGRVLGVNTSSGATEARGTVADGDGLELSDRESDTVVVTIPAQGIFYAVGRIGVDTFPDRVECGLHTGARVQRRQLSATRAALPPADGVVRRQRPGVAAAGRASLDAMAARAPDGRCRGRRTTLASGMGRGHDGVAHARPGGGLLARPPGRHRRPARPSLYPRTGARLVRFADGREWMDRPALCGLLQPSRDGAAPAGCRGPRRRETARRRGVADREIAQHSRV